MLEVFADCSFSNADATSALRGKSLLIAGKLCKLFVHFRTNP